jgi:peptidoglycan hydrolase-like protein with peptidoglycan-binding domain
MMDNLKFIVFSIIILAVVGIIGYWAVVTIQSGGEFEKNQEIAQLKKENEDLTKQVANLTDKLDTLAPAPDETTPVIQNPTTPTTPTQPTTYKNQSLINELQALVTANVFMKLKSSGTRVGTVQKFLNIYNKTSNKIDNDYGISMVKAVSAFQKAQGLSADGQAGAGTFNKMIEWLKKQV